MFGYIILLIMHCALISHDHKTMNVPTKDRTNWDDFLGVTLSFAEGRKVARLLNDIETEEAYINLMKSKTIQDDDVASRLPYRPELKYKSEWVGWDDFLVGA